MKTNKTTIFGLFFAFFMFSFVSLSQGSFIDTRYKQSIVVGGGFVGYPFFEDAKGYTFKLGYLLSLNRDFKPSNFLVGLSINSDFSNHQSISDYYFEYPGAEHVYTTNLRALDVQINYGWKLVDKRFFNFNLILGNGVYLLNEIRIRERIYLNEKELLSHKDDVVWMYTVLPSTRLDFNFKFNQHMIGVSPTFQMSTDFKKRILFGESRILGTFRFCLNYSYTFNYY